MARPTTSLVTAVEIRPPDGSPLTVWDMPVRVQKRGESGDPLTALVFHTSSELVSVTVLLTESDRKDLIKMLGGRTR